MSWAVITMIGVFSTVFVIGCAGVLFLFMSYTQSMQDRFYKVIQQRDVQDASERREQASQYADFIEMQAQREAVIAAADQEWVESPASASASDPDLDWESE